MYAGRSADCAIVQHSGMLEKLENEDAVMAARGFNIEEDCKQLNVQPHLPPFMRGEKQLFAAQEGKSRSVAVLRQLVERAIRRIKVFKILSNMFSLKMDP